MADEIADKTASQSAPPVAPPVPTTAAVPVAPAVAPVAAPAAKAPVAAAPATATAVAVVEVAPPETRVKVRKPKQRSCDQKDAKGKLCAGHLKRWYDYPQNVADKIGKEAEIYRCEFCKTLYRPDPKQMPNSYTLRY